MTDDSKPMRRPFRTQDITTSAMEDLVLAVLAEAVSGLAGVVGPSCEVVAHDLRTPETSIVAISNGHVSGRSVGGPLIGGPVNDLALKWISTADSSEDNRDYFTRTSDGRTLRSSTTLYRNARMKPFAAFCVNLDITVPRLIHDWTRSLVDQPASAVPAQHVDTEPSDVDNVLSEILHESLGKMPVPAALASKEERFRVVSQLEERGAFLVRGAVKRVAKELGVSRFTIYSYLDKIRSDDT